MSAKTLFEKIWNRHVVHEEADKPTLLYIDLHLVHEVTSPQAFEGLRENKRKVRRKRRNVKSIRLKKLSTKRKKLKRLEAK